jgi:hypothetical protein
MDGGLLHITCAGCGRINRIDHEFRVLDGIECSIDPCIICDCGDHIWASLKGWDLEEVQVRKQYASF